jgi:thiamine transport system ATP-binding protein
MREGRVVQVGTADELWARPADEDVARFLGIGVHGGSAVRPEAVVLVPARTGEGDGAVLSATRNGPTVRIVVRLHDGRLVESAVSSLDHPRPGDRVDVEIDPDGIVPLG